jgi:hypothetical protein
MPTTSTAPLAIKLDGSAVKLGTDGEDAFMWEGWDTSGTLGVGIGDAAGEVLTEGAEGVIQGESSLDISLNF